MKLIVLEGIDGSGKQTQANLLSEHMNNHKRDTLTLSFPNYDSPYGKLIRQYLDGGLDLSQFELNNTYSSDRYYVMPLIEDILKTHNLILDRYTPSNVCYGAFNGDTPERIKAIDQFLPKPDLVILIDVDPVLIDDRIKDDDKDKVEKNIEYLQKVRRNYLIQYYTNESTWRLVNGVQRQKEIHKQIVEIVDELFKNAQT